MSSKNVLNDFDGLLNWDNLQDWIAANDLPGSGPVTAVSPITGGSQNALFMMTRGNERLVLRRPPKHLRPNSNETMRREARVLTALKGSSVPHAAAYGACDDESVIGATFYVMAPLEGYSPMRALPKDYANNAQWRREMGAEMMRASAELSKVDYIAAGLSDFGKVENWHGRQVDRWRSQLEGYRGMENYPGHALPHVDETGQWLNDNLPSDGRIGIIHGDFQYPNVMYFDDRPKISGLIDWELSTLGDPLIDLGWMLSSWSGEGDPAGKEPVVTPWDNFMTRADLIALYGELTGRDMTVMPWFATLACYKLACILEGTYARACAGKAPKETGDFLHNYALWLMARAQQVIGTGKV